MSVDLYLDLIYHFINHLHFKEKEKETEENLNEMYKLTAINEGSGEGINKVCSSRITQPKETTLTSVKQKTKET